MNRVMGSVSHPPHFDGDNYAAWKAKMKSFLWALDDRVWLAVEEGWEPPIVKETKGEGQSSVTMSLLKPRREWSEEERCFSTFNQRALNALFTAVSPEQFNYISKCITAKEAWDILEVTHEGNSTVKESKLQNLITKFENIKMLDDESFSDFYAKLSVIVNGCHNLGDSIPEHRVVKKILRSLPSRFHAKRTAIEESKDLNTYKLEQLIGSLQTYESDFTEGKKGENVAFKVNNEKMNEDPFETLTQDEFALLTKQARKFLKLRSSRGHESRNNFDSNSKVPRSRDVSHGNTPKSVKLGEKKSWNDKDRCFECQGYGHHAHECANTLKRLKDEKNKALTSTWSDSGSDKDTASEDDEEVVAFIGNFEGYETDDSEVEEPDSVEVLQKYTALYDITMKVKKENEELKNKLVQLESEKKEAEIEHQSQMEHAEKLRESMLEKLHMLASDNKGLESELNDIKKKVEVFSIGSSKIEKMLSYGKISGDRSGLGFDITGSSSTSITKFVKAVQEPSRKVSSDEPFGNSCITTKESNSVRNFVDSKKFIRSKTFIPICHFCEKIGHIRPRCYKLRKENQTKHTTSWISEKSNLKGRFVAHPKGMNRISKIMPNFLTPNLKQVWRRKETQICLLDEVSPSSEEDNLTCLVAFTALSSCQSDTWYLDSGCSRHMTGDKRWFTTFTEECKNGAVTFGDGKRARIVGKGEIKTLGIPCLKNVMLVDGLKANLISISQICDDDDAEVLFNKLKCSVKVAKEVDSFEGKRSKDNCYCVNANELHVPDICNKATDDVLDLWHKRLDHMNCKDLIKLSKKEYVRGLPLLTGELNFFLGLQVKQVEDGIFVFQTKYASDLVKKFGLTSAKPVPNPMATTTKLHKDPNGKSVDQTLYRSMIGGLLYLTASRPDISFSVGACARYQADPKESHLEAVKRIIRYVSGTVEFGLHYSFETNSEIVGFSDADWAGNADDRKSTSGGCFYVGNNLVAWHSKKQNCVSLSTTKAEYIAAGSCCTQLLWMKQMLRDYGLHQNAFSISCDNTSAINISKNPVQHSRTKHIDIRHHFIRVLVEEKVLVLDYIATEHQLADLFTKPLDTHRFETLRKALGLCRVS
ncbi:hypothetical protein TB2_023225 [Malus domestica]